MGILDVAGAVEPDDYADGNDLSNIIPEAQLSAVGAAVVSDPTVDAQPGIFASTGTKVFANLTGFIWTDSDRQLRIDFTTPVSTVSIDYISDDTLDIGQLEIYNASDVLLDTYITADLGTGLFETMTLSRPASDIAYAIAGGRAGQAGLLDNLAFGQAEVFTVTDANGDYSLTVAPGPHIVREVLQAGWQQTMPGDAQFSAPELIYYGFDEAAVP